MGSKLQQLRHSYLTDLTNSQVSEVRGFQRNPINRQNLASSLHAAIDNQAGGSEVGEIDSDINIDEHCPLLCHRMSSFLHLPRVCLLAGDAVVKLREQRPFLQVSRQIDLFLNKQQESILW